MSVEEDALENLEGVAAPSEHAIQEHAKEESEKAAQYAGLLDKMGRPFDPGLHRTKADGEPVLTKQGLLTIKSGRKAGTQTHPITSTPPADPQTQPAAPDPFKTGAETVMLIETVGVMVGGEAFAIKEAGERDAMVSAWGRCYEKWGVSEIPPEVALVAAMGGYALLHEGRRNKIFEAIKSVAPKREAKETPTLELVRNEENGTRTDRGPNGVGKVPFGKGTRDPLPTPGSD